MLILQRPCKNYNSCHAHTKKSDALGLFYATLTKMVFCHTRLIIEINIILNLLQRNNHNLSLPHVNQPVRMSSYTAFSVSRQTFHQTPQITLPGNKELHFLSMFFPFYGEANPRFDHSRKIPDQ